jgi:hypothetical protein
VSFDGTDAERIEADHAHAAPVVEARASREFGQSGRLADAGWTHAGDHARRRIGEQ